ncbi:acyl carrier protein phosphodiesterase [Thorsellia kenyensis]|uniref:ACP phosphodiesterase n=1 Tax=Thorsellia kenyensis TaxID=1549888 RepID=A0ABV6CBF7_9GAMM
MNFLAHVYLSDNIPLRAIGNFIADSVKGKDYLNYHGEMRIGILLHRKIDSYTDGHPIFRQSVRRLFEQYRHYSPVIVDMFYDHFLAKYFSQFHSVKLEVFIRNFYLQLEDHLSILPKSSQRIVPILLSENWFLKYKTIEGLEEILVQMDKRKPRQSIMHQSIRELLLDYSDFENDFFQFMPLIKTYAKHQADDLLIKNNL